MISGTNRWLNHTWRRAPWRTQRQAAALIVMGFFVAVIIGALYLSQSASMATAGRQLEVLLAQRSRLEQANEQLRAEIASLRSVPRLQQRAREMGFDLAHRSDIEYLVIEGYNPTRPEDVQLPVRGEQNAVPVYDETFLGWLQQQFDAFTGGQPSGE